MPSFRMKTISHVALVACLALEWMTSCILAESIYCDDPELCSNEPEAEKKADQYLRFGRGGAGYMRFGRDSGADDLQERSIRGDPFLRFGKRDSPYLRFGRGDPFLRFGKSDPFLRFGRGDPFLRFGKRGDPFLRFGRQDPILRFGKRGDPFLRFGRQDPFLRFGRGDPFLRFGRQDPILRFGKRGDPFLRFGRQDPFLRFGKRDDDSDLAADEGVGDGIDEEILSREVRSAEVPKSTRRRRSVEQQDGDNGGQGEGGVGEDEKRSYMRFGRNYMRFGKKDTNDNSGENDNGGDDKMSKYNRYYKDLVSLQHFDENKDNEEEKQKKGQQKQAYMRFGRSPVQPFSRFGNTLTAGKGK